MNSPYDNMRTRNISGQVLGPAIDQPYVPGHEEMWRALESMRDHKRKPYQTDNEILNEFRVIIGKVLRGES